MHTKKSLFIRLLLSPIAAIYKMVVAVRNRLYDLEILKSEPTAIPSVSVGNITVGGTGKTPHCEYIIRLLQQKGYNVAYLSRGYMRKSSNFQLATPDSTPEQLGDEAYQVYKHIEGITLAVDKNRHNAIAKLGELKEPPQVIVLDDAYQHRALTSNVNILLINYNQPIFGDYHLPLGRLREAATNTDRAEIIIVTKCPEDMQRVEVLEHRTNISPYPYQSLFFTTFSYSTPKNVLTDKELDLSTHEVLVVSGIADPNTLYRYLQRRVHRLHSIMFRDHHNFTPADFKTIEAKFAKLDSRHRAILITEKDKARLNWDEIPEVLKPHIYSIDISIKFLFDEEEKFDKKLVELLTKGKR